MTDLKKQAFKISNDLVMFSCIPSLRTTEIEILANLFFSPFFVTGKPIPITINKSKWFEILHRLEYKDHVQKNFKKT